MRVFLDLEMNPVSRQYKEICRKCTTVVIEFGAVKLNDNYEEVDSFQSFVKPEYNDTIEKYITGLTGIKTADVINAPLFSEVMRSFINWCGVEYEIYSWSMTDPIQLQSEMELKNIARTEQSEVLFSEWNDLQKQYGEQIGIARLTKLSSAVYVAGVDFRGRAHSALADAMATADIFREMRRGSLRVIADNIEESSKPIGTSLAGLLNIGVFEGA